MLFFTNNWTTSQPMLAPLSKAFQTPPAVDMCAPNFILRLKRSRDGIAHFGSPNFLGVGIGGVKNIASPEAGRDGFPHGVFNRGRGIVQLKAVAQHERGGKYLRDRVGQIFTSNIGCCAARRFVKAEG